jgi:hypothetical protein
MKTMLPVLVCMGMIVTVGGCPESAVELPSEDTLVIFHNGSGPMCLEATDWLATIQPEHPDLVVEEHLTTNPANLLLLAQMKPLYGQSQGVSTTFAYLPIIFFKGQAFSGFNDEVKNALTALIEAMDVPAS